MNKINQSMLDQRLLTMFVAVHETGSVTSAALSLNVTQSTVSHGLNRLRELTGDALFVPMGRGITATDKADLLVEDARRILQGMERFSELVTYDPEQDDKPFILAASDYEIEIIVKTLIPRLRRYAPNAQIQIIRAFAQEEWVDLLRSGKADLALSPELTSAETDIKQQAILKDEPDTCFYDVSCRTAPDTLDAYCAADHIIMSPGRFRRTNVDKILSQLGKTRNIAVSLPNFTAVATILQGTDMVATMPRRLKASTFSAMESCSPPFSMPSDTITQIWHIRSDTSQRHRWLRSQVRMASSGK